MSTLVVVAYPNEFQAEEVRLRLLKMQKEYLVELEDAVIAIRKENGKVKLLQLYNLTGAGAVSGGFWGMRMGPEQPRPMAGDSQDIRQAIDFINMGRYQYADSTLNAMPGAMRNARWYYLSSLANYGLRNQMLAVSQIQKAIQLEPNNPLYQRTLQSFRYAENTYNQNGRDFQREAEGMDRFCRSFCLAQLFCMFCCR